MDDKAPLELTVAARQRSEAYTLAAWRVGGVVALWGIATMLRPSTQPLLALPLDVGLALGAWWALRPGHQDGGPEFLQRGHWTNVLIVPPLLGAVLALGDLWRLWAGEW